MVIGFISGNFQNTTIDTQGCSYEREKGSVDGFTPLHAASSAKSLGTPGIVRSFVTPLQSHTAANCKQVFKNVQMCDLHHTSVEQHTHLVLTCSNFRVINE